MSNYETEIFDLIDKLRDHGVDLEFDWYDVDSLYKKINGISEPEPEPEPEPDPGNKELYKVKTDKPSGRVKVRPEPSKAVGEISFVYNGDVVERASNSPEMNGFYMIKAGNGSHGPYLGGWVEKEYLISV